MDKYNKRLHSYQKFLDKFSIEKDRNISDDMKRREKVFKVLGSNLKADVHIPEVYGLWTQLVDICPITVAGQPENLVMYTSPSVCNSDANHTERRLILFMESVDMIFVKVCITIFLILINIRKRQKVNYGYGVETDFYIVMIIPLTVNIFSFLGTLFIFYRTFLRWKYDRKYILLSSRFPFYIAIMGNYFKNCL
uniref:Uncharacterized protein n=1 Tax=Rhizophagus irregularis (strain DAOM 181602 / DAOM 197198 / MUCL 43194) TaxID=747089 RepID=U9TXP7_RHIID